MIRRHEKRKKTWKNNEMTKGDENQYVAKISARRYLSSK